MNNILHTSLHFPCGAIMPNRFMLAPLTNRQSHEDGTLSDDEYHWLTKRAEGGFGLVMTCASHVQAVGKGFPGQLGIFSDQHIDGHKRLVKGIQTNGSLAVIQLHHAGMRSPADIIGEAPVCPSDNEEFEARGLRIEEVHELRDDFIQAAIRAKKSGYDGVEVHGAHGYILTQFISAEHNSRNDEYGGGLHNRTRILFEIVDGIRAECGPSFLVGVRLSPERFGMQQEEIKSISQRLIEEGKIDFLDLSLWDVFKRPEGEDDASATLLEYLTQLDRKKVKITAAGKIRSGADVKKAMDADLDFVTIGRSGILHFDFPLQVMQNPNFEPIETPVSKTYLKDQGLRPDFVKYMSKWPGFVEE